MATQGMQMAQTATAPPAVRRTTVILAVAAALTVGAVIGRETATRSQTASAVRPAAAIALTGTNSADAVRRAEVYTAVGALATPITLVGTDSTDAARRAEVFQAMTALRARRESFGAVGQRLTDGERRALVYRLVTAGTS